MNSARPYISLNTAKPSAHYKLSHADSPVIDKPHMLSAANSPQHSKFKGQFKSLYMEDYKQKKPIANRCFNANLKSVKLYSPSISNSSTFKSDFISHGLIKTDSCKNERSQYDELFMGKSSYQTNYIDWKLRNPRMDQLPRNRIVSLPFLGSSSYKNTFVPFDLGCKSHRIPEMKCHVDSQFKYKSTAQDTYQQHKVDKTQGYTEKSQERKVFSFPGQFLTESRRSYSQGIGKYSPTESAKRKDHPIF